MEDREIDDSDDDDDDDENIFKIWLVLELLIAVKQFLYW